MNENRGCIAQNLIALRIKEEYNAEFIYYWMNSNQYFSLINKVLMGAVQPSLKVPHLLQFEIQLPIQREQEKIAEILSNHDETIRLLEREIIYLKQQKQGLMQLLLTGKVRVKV
ncbi:MAG: restriction endonuclease subunit S [Bacillaceae bacterium]|nr:restriction endonuclease subunit S [Bacillaceae bacterium]